MEQEESVFGYVAACIMNNAQRKEGKCADITASVESETVFGGGGGKFVLGIFEIN